MRVFNGQTWITIIGPDGHPLDRVGVFDFSGVRKDERRERRRARMRRKKRRGYA